MAKGRLVVTYFDGSWTDNLAIGDYGLRNNRDGITLRIEVEPRERPGKVRLANQALREFATKRLKIHTIQIGKPEFTAQLRSVVRGLENTRLGLQLCAEGVDVLYPAGVVFGPDEITLNLG